MRVECKECGSKGRITSRENVSALFADLYCQCGSARCGHTWVSQLTFSHTLNPSAQSVDKSLFDRLRSMPVEKQQELFDQLCMQPAR